MALSILRRLGYAIGSVTIAWLAIGLVAGVAFGPASRTSWIVWILVLVLGGLIYREIVSRERPSA